MYSPLFHYSSTWMIRCSLPGWCTHNTCFCSSSVCVCVIRFRRSQTTLCSNSLSPFFHNNSCSCIFPYGRPDRAEYANEKKIPDVDQWEERRARGRVLKQTKPLPLPPSLSHTHTHTHTHSMVNLELILPWAGRLLK